MEVEARWIEEVECVKKGQRKLEKNGQDDTKGKKNFGIFNALLGSKVQKPLDNQ